jgi:RNA exonuclease 4
MHGCHEQVQAAVAQLLDGKVLVGHSVDHDLEVLQLTHPPELLRDTARSGWGRAGRRGVGGVG